MLNAKLKIGLTVILAIVSIFLYAQNHQIDSLQSLLKNDKPDTNKLNHLNELSGEYDWIGSLNSAMLYANSALELNSDIQRLTRNPKVIKAAQKDEAYTYNMIGLIYTDLGNFPEALKNHLISLRLKEALNDKASIAATYNNIGNVYDAQLNFPKALKYYFDCLKIMETMGKKDGIAASYVNIGTIYAEQGNYPEALKNYFASLKIKEELGDKKGKANPLNNIGIVYNLQGKYVEALQYYFASLKIRDSIGDKAGIAESYGNIGDAYTNQKKFKEAEKYLVESKELSKKIGAREYLKTAYRSLTKLDSSRENFRGAYDNLKLYILYRDSLDNEQTRKKTLLSEITFDFEKKAAIEKAKYEKELEKQQALSEEESRKQKVVILFIIVGLFIVLVFAGFIFRSLHVTRKQKSIIEEQKHLVDEKNEILNQQNEEISSQRDEIEAQRDLVTEQKTMIEEIHRKVSDSINYAKRIQDAVLPSDKFTASILEDHFVLFKPKDIVSGDFYWTTKINEWLIFTVADSTGHGVPGAFMSMLGISFLNELVRKKEVVKASEVLEQLRFSIIEALRQSLEAGTPKDGMDIALCVLNTNTLEMQYAGANSPILIISNNTKELTEIGADRITVSISHNMKPFTNRIIQVQKGDTIYLASDGYEDQFGGLESKKFSSRRLKQLLIEVQSKPLIEQKEILESTIDAWINCNGNKYEQTDDITVMGVRI